MLCSLTANQKKRKNGCRPLVSSFAAMKYENLFQSSRASSWRALQRKPAKLMSPGVGMSDGSNLLSSSKDAPNALSASGVIWSKAWRAKLSSKVLRTTTRLSPTCCSNNVVCSGIGLLFKEGRAVELLVSLLNPFVELGGSDSYKFVYIESIRALEYNHNLFILLVGERGFEPPTPWSRTRCSTRLSHSPTAWVQGARARARAWRVFSLRCALG